MLQRPHAESAADSDHRPTTRQIAGACSNYSSGTRSIASPISRRIDVALAVPALSRPKE